MCSTAISLLISVTNYYIVVYDSLFPSPNKISNTEINKDWNKINPQFEQKPPLPSTPNTTTNIETTQRIEKPPPQSPTNAVTEFTTHIKPRHWKYEQPINLNNQPNISSINLPSIAPAPKTPAPTFYNWNSSYKIPDISLQDMPYFINKSVVWLGMVNNANRTISHILDQLNQVSCIFKNSFFFFFESNSKDETPQILKNWSRNLTQLHTISKDMSHLSTIELENRYLMQKYCNQLRYRGRRKTNIIESYKELDVIESIHNHMPNMIKKSIIMGDDLVKKDLEYEELSRSNATYHHTLSRVERFVQYRNMLLHETYMSTGIDLYVKQSGSSITNIFSRKVKQESALKGSVDMDALRTIDWDYVIIIDLDVWEIDFVSFFNELKDCPYSVMCINGVDKEDEYRDSFATVELNHNWIHRPFIFNRSDRYYEKARHILRKKMPRKNQRYEEVKSCFNGLAAYRMSPRDLYNSHCEYYLNNEINAISVKSNGTVQWVHDIARLVAWNDLKGPMYDIFAGYEWHLCEHIPFHYCLGDYGYDISISSNAKLYYYPLSPPVTAEERRSRRRERSRRRRRRRAESRARAALNRGRH